MEEVSVIGLPMMYAGDIDDVSTMERARRRLALERRLLTRSMVKPGGGTSKMTAKALSFSEGKKLAHRIFDEIALPRPHVKCMPLGYRMLGYATPK